MLWRDLVPQVDSMDHIGTLFFWDGVQLRPMAVAKDKSSRLTGDFLNSSMSTSLYIYLSGSSLFVAVVMIASVCVYR